MQWTTTSLAHLSLQLSTRMGPSLFLADLAPPTHATGRNTYTTKSKPVHKSSKRRPQIAATNRVRRSSKMVSSAGLAERVRLVRERAKRMASKILFDKLRFVLCIWCTALSTDSEIRGSQIERGEEKRKPPQNRIEITALKSLNLLWMRR